MDWTLNYNVVIDAKSWFQTLISLRLFPTCIRGKDFILTIHEFSITLLLYIEPIPV